MDVSTEVQTSRGPVMVMTLPQFAEFERRYAQRGS